MLREILRGARVDLDAATRSVGESISYLLCDAFRVCELPNWFDGFVVEAIERRPDDTVLLRGLAWCADHRTQWKVPAEAELLCTPDADPCLRSVRVRVGDRSTGLVPIALRSAWPKHWLHDFQIEATWDDRDSSPARD